MALTSKQIEGVIAAQKEMDEIDEKLSEKAKPYLIVAEQLESAAKKNGFASYDEYTNVVDNISLVLAGFYPATKKYIGSDAVIRAQIAQVQADKSMPTEDKTEALDELNNALKSPAPPVENKGNIELVADTTTSSLMRWGTTPDDETRSTGSSGVTNGSLRTRRSHLGLSLRLRLSRPRLAQRSSASAAPWHMSR